MKYSFLLDGPRWNSAMHFTRMEEQASGIIAPQPLASIVMQATVEHQPVPEGLHIPEPSDPVYALIDPVTYDHAEVVGKLCSQPDYSLDELTKDAIITWDNLCSNGPAIVYGKVEARFNGDKDGIYIATEQERDALYAVESYVNTHLLPAPPLPRSPQAGPGPKLRGYA